MNDYNTNEGQQVEWNLSSGLIQEISELLASSNRHYINGRYSKAYSYLKAVKSRVIQNLGSKERKRFLKIEKLLCKHISVGFHTKANSDVKRKDIALSQTKAVFLIDKYNEELMDCLDKYGYLIGRKKDSKKIF